MSDNFKKVRLAAVQAAPVLNNRDASVEKACALIKEAGRNGADIIGFPEGFIASHPGWVNFIAAQDTRALKLTQAMFKSAIEIPSAATMRLTQACREAGIFAVVGVNEKLPNTTGTMWNTQLFIDKNGTLLGKHQKLVPTLGERVVHTDGHPSTMRTFQSHFGAVSGLICGENSNPLSAFALSLDYPLVHVASWPAHFNTDMLMQDSIKVATQGLAYQLKVFVINSCANISDEMIEAYGESEQSRNHMLNLQKLGGASIIAPSGKTLAEMEPGEGLLYRDVDLEDVIIPKVVHDVAGHYSRPELFFSIGEKIMPRLTGAARQQALQTRWVNEHSPLIESSAGRPRLPSHDSTEE